MNGYSDAEQRDLLKKWWRENGKAVLIAVGLSLLLSYGWRYWRQEQSNKTELAAQLYQQLVVASVEQHPEVVLAAAQRLQQQFPHSPYASLGELWWAQQEVLVGHMDTALQALQTVVDKSKVAYLRALAFVQMVRIRCEQKKYVEAEQLLSQITDVAYKPLVDRMRGDIALAQGKTDVAIKNYQQAAASFTAWDVATPLFDMQLQALGAIPVKK